MKFPPPPKDFENSDVIIALKQCIMVVGRCFNLQLQVLTCCGFEHKR